MGHLRDLAPARHSHLGFQSARLKPASNEYLDIVVGALDSARACIEEDQNSHLRHVRRSKTWYRVPVS